MHNFAMLALLCFSLLSACGNGNDGRPLGKKKTAAVANPVQAGNLPMINLSYCKNLTTLAGTNPAFSEIFAGSSVCKVNSAVPMVRFKSGMNFPAQGRFCLVPMADFAFQETCFTSNGQVDLQIDANASAYSAIVIVAESDLAAYKAFLNFQQDNAPPRAIALMNQ